MLLARVLTLAFGILLAPFAAEAQPAGNVPRISFICARPGPSSHTRAFEAGLRDLGYVIGKNIAVEYRFAPTDGHDPFPSFAADLVRLKMDVIVVGTPVAIRPAQGATRTIPLVMAQGDDPVLAGLVASLARPGGNLTGLSSMAPELSAKQLELLKELVPNLSRAAVLWSGASRVATPQMQALERAAESLGVRLESFAVRGGDPKEFKRAFSAITKTRISGLIATPDMMFFDHLDQLVALAAKNRLPTIYGEREFVDAGGLVSYGTNYDDLFRRAATYVHKILKGAKPAGLPVEQPTRFDLVINLKTAKALGLTIPQSVLIRADHVIQ